MLRPSGVRARLTSAVGPDASASKPGSQGCAQMPEKSGLAAPPGVACPDTGTAAMVANAAAFNAFLSFIATSQGFGKPILHRFCVSLNPALFKRAQRSARLDDPTIEILWFRRGWICTVHPVLS